MGMEAESLIRRFQLEPHPEGGFFRESYRSDLAVDFPDFQGARNVSTGIYFLLPAGARSCLHRIQSDEMWHFYLGGPMSLVELYDDGRLNRVTLGQDITAGQMVQHVVPAGCWFGGFPLEGSAYSFVGCTVAPGFDFHDFELAERDTLLQCFPEHEDIIRQLS